MGKPKGSKSAASGRRLRALAGALSVAPIGFAAGAILSGRYLVVAGGSPGVAILTFALLAAVAAGVAMAWATALLPPRPARIMTIVAGGVSFAILVYMVQDFIVDRVERARAFDHAYALVPSFELTLATSDRQRRPFSELSFESDSRLDTRDYAALRPGGWLCLGSARRDHKLALFRAIRAAEREPPDDGACRLWASWRIADETPVPRRCADAGEGFSAMFAAADEMVDSTERYASCRRASGLQSAEPAATIDD